MEFTKAPSERSLFVKHQLQLVLPLTAGQLRRVWQLAPLCHGCP